MSMKLTFNMEAFRGIEEALEGLRTVRTRKTALQRGMMRAAEPMAEIARGLAPVHEGHLVKSIGVGTKLTRRQAALFKEADEGKGDVTVFAGAGGTPAAVQQEFGNIHHGPHPFMRPAWDQDSRAMLQRLAEMVREEIAKSLKRQRRR